MSILYYRLVVGGAVTLVGAGLAVFLITRREKRRLGPALALTLLGMVVMVGGRFHGFGIKAEVEDFSQLAKALAANPAPPIDDLAKKFDAGVEVWWKLLQYRIDLRAAVRDICGLIGGKWEGKNPPFSYLLECAREREALSQDTADELDRIRCYTFYAEWRAGTPPDNAAVAFVLDHGPSLVEELNISKVACSPKMWSDSCGVPEPGQLWKSLTA